jgi:hypothetical protein
MVRLFPRSEHAYDPDLIRSLFPCQVNNSIALPAFSSAYHLHLLLRASPSQIEALRLQKGCRSELWEAYMAGIFKQVCLTSFARPLQDLYTLPDALTFKSAVRIRSSARLASRGPDTCRSSRSCEPQGEEARSSRRRSGSSLAERRLHRSSCASLSNASNLLTPGADSFFLSSCYAISSRTVRRVLLFFTRSIHRSSFIRR